MGQFLGLQDEHSSLVENFSRFIIEYISPQFHLVLDYLFETVICNRDDDSVFNAICNDLIELNMDWYAKGEHDDTGNLIHLSPPLEDVWIYVQGRRDCRRELDNQKRHQEYFIREKNRAVPDIIPLNTKYKGDRLSTGAPVSDDKSSFYSQLGHPPIEPEGDFVSDNAEGGYPDSPSPDYNIPPQ